MWNRPGPGIESTSPALAGGFLTTGPPGKSLFWRILIFSCSVRKEKSSLWNAKSKLELKKKKKKTCVGILNIPFNYDASVSSSVKWEWEHLPIGLIKIGLRVKCIEEPSRTFFQGQLHCKIKQELNLKSLSRTLAEKLHSLSCLTHIILRVFFTWVTSKIKIKCS